MYASVMFTLPARILLISHLEAQVRLRTCLLGIVVTRFFILRDISCGVFVGFILFHAGYYTDCSKECL